MAFQFHLEYYYFSVNDLGLLIFLRLAISHWIEMDSVLGVRCISVVGSLLGLDNV